MRFADLQAFVDVVESGGMTQAAAVKGVSQPGLSRTIRDLERSMQATLLRRTGRGVELTPAGAEFLKFARSSLEALEIVRRRTREMSGAMPEKLRIGIPPRLGTAVFPDLYRRFMLEFPDIGVTATEAYTAELAEGLSAGRFDLIVSFLVTVPGSGDGIPVFRERLYLVDGKAGASSGDTPITLAEVAGLPILLNQQASPYRRLVESVFASAGHKLTVSREIETAEGLLAFASEGEGATILPFSNFHAEAARGDVTGRLIIDPSIERNVYIHTGRHLNRRAADLAMAIVLRCLQGVAETFQWFPIRRADKSGHNG